MSEVMDISLCNLDSSLYFIQPSVSHAALNMPANLENSAVATGLEKISFHSNSKERRTKSLLMKVKEENEKVGLKLNTEN